MCIIDRASAELKFGEHVRHLKSRAQRLADEGDTAGERHCLELARVVCDDADHELLYDQAVGHHDRGELHAAWALYNQADQLAGGRDARVATNLAALRTQMGHVHQHKP